MLIDYSTYSEIAKNNASEDRGPRVGFFTLKNDGDEALVRLLVDSPADFQVVAVHQSTIGGRMRNVNCIRSAQDPIENCPLCAAGQSVRYRLYIPVLEYVKGDDGRIQTLARIWERPASFTSTLKNHIVEYGPLSKVLFKAKRSGTGTATKYDLLYAAAENRNPDGYPEKAEMFDGYNIMGTAVVSKDFQGLVDLLSGEDGADVAVPKTAPVAPAGRTYTPTYGGNQPSVGPRADAAPGFTGTETTARPRRFY